MRARALFGLEARSTSFGHRGDGNVRVIAPAPETLQRQIALLRILIGCGEKALEAFQAADNPVDIEFVDDLERILARSRDELAVLVEHSSSRD